MLASTVSSASAQNYSFDARRIALGGTAGTPNVASKLVERQRRYRSITIPVGLIRVLTNVRVFYPNRDDFDLSRAVEFSTRPLHFSFGRGHDPRGRTLFSDITRARLTPDLNAYRGFDVATSTSAEGLVSPYWGKTFMLRQDDRSFQGLFVGGGPYLSARAYADFDSALVGVLNASGDRYVPAASLGVGGGETNQLAVAITGGYRARFPLFLTEGAEARRNGMYVAANYHYLHGLRLDEFDSRLQLDTDEAGLVIPNPPGPPFTLDWDTSRKGRGLATDFGVAFVVNRWDFGAGVGGVANRINWTKITRHNVSLVSLFGGSEFVHIKFPVTNAKKRIELPVTYTADAAYHREVWSAYTEFSRGFMGNHFRSALEYRLGEVELRGGIRNLRGSWYPSGGVGFNLTRNFGVDMAFFGTKTFLESKNRLAMAVSLRIDRR